MGEVFLARQIFPLASTEVRIEQKFSLDSKYVLQCLRVIISKNMNKKADIQMFRIN
jgi:hypothetical protein